MHNLHDRCRIFRLALIGKRNGVDLALWDPYLPICGCPVPDHSSIGMMFLQFHGKLVQIARHFIADVNLSFSQFPNPCNKNTDHCQCLNHYTRPITYLSLDLIQRP